MVLGFNKKFVTPIRLGAKIHTIREDKKSRWRPGMTIHMATGVRTKKYDCFGEATCVSVQKFRIEYKGRQFSIFVDDRQLSVSEIKKIAALDGFATIADFMDWFNKDFTGRIIHWTNYKY